MLGWRTGRTGVASEKVRFLCLNQSSKGAEYALDDFRNTAVLWLLGLVSSYTLGGFIHILLVVALVILVINLLSGRRTAV